ncbi:hypothetical protein D9M68_588960 [compost metagenome]
MSPASRRHSASPRPVPPKRRAMLLSACVKGSNSAFCCAAVMPMPVSLTPITTGEAGSASSFR